MSDEAEESAGPAVSGAKLTDLPDGAHNAVHIATGARHWHWYAIAYKEAADRLGTVADDPYAQNHIGPALLFLYRHYVELHLKSLLLDAGQLLDDPQAVPPKHYLLRLWERVRSLLLRVDPAADGPSFARADEIIKALDELDPTSYAFRYPVATNGSASLPHSMHFDPRVLANVINDLHALLNGASTQIDVYDGYKQFNYSLIESQQDMQRSHSSEP